MSNSLSHRPIQSGIIRHLGSNGLTVTRHDSFSALPFLAQSKAVTLPKRVAVSKAAVPAKAIAPEDRLEKLIKRLKGNSAPRPKKKASLLARIGTDFGNKLNEAELNQKLDELVRRGILVIEDKVRYL